MKVSAFAGVFALFCCLVLAVLARENSFSYQKCKADQAAQQTSDKHEMGPVTVIENVSHAINIRCTGRLINKMNAVITALATLVISAFTVVLVIVTNRQAKLTAASVAIAKDALLKTERAFVYIDGFTPELTTAADAKVIRIDDLPERYKDCPELYITRFAVMPRWKNSGSTATRNMTIQVNWRGPTGPDPIEYSYRAPPEPFFLAPNAAEHSAVIEMPPAAAIVDWSWRPRPPEPFILIWGRADYDDIFGNHHFVEWCYRLRFERHKGERMNAGFIQWGEHNRSDGG